MNKYTKQEIKEAIEHWEIVLEELNEMSPDEYIENNGATIEDSQFKNRCKFVMSFEGIEVPLEKMFDHVSRFNNENKGKEVKIVGFNALVGHPGYDVKFGVQNKEDAVAYLDFMIEELN